MKREKLCKYAYIQYSISRWLLLLDSPYIVTDPDEVVRITYIQASAKIPIPMIALGLVTMVKQNRIAVITK